MKRKRHEYPRLEWTLCSEVPTDSRRVLVWHRCRPWCRYFQFVIGWWNSEEWRRDDSHWEHGLIHQPTLWKDVEPPDVN